MAPGVDLRRIHVQTVKVGETPVLARDHDEKFVLVYDDIKNNRAGRRLPITQGTATLIADQQQSTRERYPQVPTSELLLLPSAQQNPFGRRAMSRKHLGRAHREWLNAVAQLRRADGSNYDPDTITPYSYRHTYVISPAVAG